MTGIALAKQLAWTVVCAQNHSYEHARPLVKNFYSGSRAVRDPDVIQRMQSAPNIMELLNTHDVIDRFQSAFGPWLLDNEFNHIQGLQDFVADISQGATQAFDSFFLQYAGHRIAFLQGEYFYHVLSAQYLDRQYACIRDHSELRQGDLLVMSWPFCDTGNAPIDAEDILCECDRLGIPVLLDCAYFTISHGTRINLNHECIKTVAFSLSKTFPVAHARIGVRYLRPDIMDGQRLHSRINYDNRVSAGLGLFVIENFSSDYICKKYRTISQWLIATLGLRASDSVLFADGDESWSLWSRRDLLETYGLAMDYRLFRNRICLTGLLENKDLVCKILQHT